MVMSELSVEHVAKAITQYLSSGHGEDDIAEALNYEIKDLKVRRALGEQDLPFEQLRATYRYWQTLPRPSRSNPTSCAAPSVTSC